MFTSDRSNVWEVAARTLDLRVENRQCPPRCNVTIETLCDDVLLEIFDLCLVKDEDFHMWCCQEDKGYSYDAWYSLVHVCQRWRYVVFASPRRLNLRLHCSRRRVREMLGVWPVLPIVILDMENFTSDENNVIAALEHRGRVCELNLERLTKSQSRKLAPFMRQSFPALTKLQIKSPPGCDLDLLVLPDSFLGGSTPHLRFLCLACVSFPALPNLLLSASNLACLYLRSIPSGYILPEMVAALSTLSRLEVMDLMFGYPNYDHDLRDAAPLPLTRSALPALKSLEVEGDTEYVDDFVARIDVPSINDLKINFCGDETFGVDHLFHLPQFVDRVEKLWSFYSARFDLSPLHMDVTLSPRRQRHGSHRRALQLKFLCNTDGPLQALVDACNISLLPLSNVKKFAMCAHHSHRGSQSGFNEEDPLWLEVLRQFPAAKSLYLVSMDFVIPVAFALKQVIEEGMTDVLPAIQELIVSSSLPAGPVREAIEQFVTARGLSVFETPRPGSFRWRISPRNTHEG